MRKDVEIKRGLFPITTVCLVIISLVIILSISYWYFTAPPPGWCVAENRFLSNNEKIEKVVVKVLEDYPKVTHRKTTPSNNGEYADGDWTIPPGEGDGSSSSVKMHKPSYPIPYKDIKEFFELNPSCCFVTQDYRSKYHDGGSSITDWDRFTGKKSTIVVAMWLLRYMDNDGTLRTEVLERYKAMDNCGNFVDEEY